MEEAREKALQEVTEHYETKLVEKEQQREQVKGFVNCCAVSSQLNLPCTSRVLARLETFHPMVWTLISSAESYMYVYMHVYMYMYNVPATCACIMYRFLSYLCYVR